MKKNEREIKGKVARVVIVNPDGTIILNRRPDWSEQAAGELQIMGGKIKEYNPETGEGDQTRKHAAQREMREELGLKTTIGEFLFFNASENNGWITFAFILLLSENYEKSMMPNHEEFDSIHMIDPSRILSLIEEGEIAFDHPEILKKFLEIMEIP